MSLVWLLHLLPYRLQVGLGPLLGWLFMLFNPYRRLVVNTNLALCFPQLDDSERSQLGKRVFKSLGFSMVEEANSIWAPGHFFDQRGQVQGLEHIRAAQQQGKGVLLLSGHFCSVDFAGRVLIRHQPTCFTYQELRNPLSNHILTKARDKFTHCIIHRHDMRGFIKALRAGKVVWYAPDQSQARKNSVFAPFFGIPANTLTATTKLAKITGAAVLPFEIKRLPGARGYALTIQPALENFPGESETADAARFNALLAALVRDNPVKYMCIHGLFKKRPEGEPQQYPPKPRRVRRMERKKKKRAARLRAEQASRE
jgi:KDO2-lipid IV(A) lauroyltransferase